MEIKLMLMITLLPYSIIVSQSLYYIISLRNVQQQMQAGEYIRFRQLTDKNFRAKFGWVMYSAFISNLLLVTACLVYFSSFFLLSCAALAMAGLAADSWLTLKGNMPINNIVNTWTKTQYPVNWADYRSRWLKVFAWRQLANISGFVCLLDAAVFS